LLALPSCSDEDAPTVAVSAQALEAEEAARGELEEFDCVKTEPASVVRVALEDGLEAGEIRVLSDRGELHLVVANDSSLDGTVVLAAETSSRAGFRDVELARVDLGAGESTVTALSAADLDLPKGTFDFSGSLAIEASLIPPGGDRSDPFTLHLYFHPSEEGWEIYDAVALTAVYAGGLLTDAARERDRLAQDANAGRVAAHEPVTTVAVESIPSVGGVQ
jgi:hypothetical protein